MIFSYMMGIFIDILNEYQKLNADLDQGDELAQFLGLLTKFNEDVPLPDSFKIKLEEYFEYKWVYDRNQAIDDEAE